MTKTWGVTGPVSVWGIAHEDTDDMEWLLLSEGWRQFVYICFIFYLFYSYIIITFFICSIFILLLHFLSVLFLYYYYIFLYFFIFAQWGLVAIHDHLDGDGEDRDDDKGNVEEGD